MEKEFLKDLFCHQCQLQFNGKAVYNLHLSLVHEHDSDNKVEENQRKSSFECDKCDEKFMINKKLKEHVTTIHGGKVPSWVLQNIFLSHLKTITMVT